MTIPIRNIYYMFCYATDLFEPLDVVPTGVVARPEPLDLLAAVLSAGCERLLRAGPERRYVEIQDTIPGVRGKLLLGPTVTTAVLECARTVCEFDELSYDVLPNQILKATLKRLVRHGGLDPEIADRARVVLRWFQVVSDIRLEAGHFNRVVVHRNNRRYGLLMSVCRYLFDCTLPETGGNRQGFSDFTHNHRIMWRLFQEFLRGFWKVHAKGWRVYPPRGVSWQGVPSSNVDRAKLPRLFPDIVMRDKRRWLVIDAKFYPTPLIERHGMRKLRSSHMYQIFSYARNWQLRFPDRKAEGVLVYAAVDDAFDFRYEIDDCLIRACAVDLSSEWPRIETRLLGLLGDWAPPIPSPASSR